jgi:hypothetical protein
MNTLNLGSDEIPATKKKSNTRNLKIALGLAAVILVPTIGSTLAGQISINADAAVEFGQGISITAACGNITLTPSTSFDNASGDTGIFAVETVTLSAIPSGCSGKTFTIKAWPATTDVAIPLSSRPNDALVINPTLDNATDCTNAGLVPAAPATADETAVCEAVGSVMSVVITVNTDAAADDIYKFTVETA